MLMPGYEVITGRRNQRVWRVGGVHPDPGDRTLVGKLGWEPLSRDVVPQWSEETKDWLSETSPSHRGRVVPFGFDGDTRLLTVLRDGRTPPTTTASVFERILRDNERELPEPSTEWSVEPVLDAADFLGWLATLDTVFLVSFTAKLPNPEPRARFANLAQRLKNRHATSYTEILRSDREVGLRDVEHDSEIQQAIAMGEQGFANLRGEGTRSGTVSHYNQRNRVANERVEVLPESWEDTWKVIKRLLKGQLRRFLDDGPRA
jgi:hypothetical protein